MHRLDTGSLIAVLGKLGIDAKHAEHNYFPTPDSYKTRLQSHGFRVDYIELIPRPTPLPDTGMRGWLETFRRGLLDQVAAEKREQVIEETVAMLKPVLCDDQGNGLRIMCGCDLRRWQCKCHGQFSVRLHHRDFTRPKTGALNDGLFFTVLESRSERSQAVWLP